MQLRQKFGLLVLIYVLSLSANLILSGWCIIVFFRSAFIEFDADLAWEQRIDRLRDLARQQRALLQEQRYAPELVADYTDREAELTSAMGKLEAEMAGRAIASGWPQIKEAALRADAVARTRLTQLVASGPGLPTSMPAADLTAFIELDRLLGRLAAALADERHENVARVADVQERIVKILLMNTVGGAILCALGVVFVTRWVIRPVAALREAAREIGSGNLSHRIQVQSRDELGKLADEVNQMASTIVEMQTRLIEKERLAAAGEMFTRVAHNIRNPLAGMRGLAEATVERHADSRETVDCQNRIIDTIDRFEKWLRDVQQSVSAMTLDIQATRIDELITNVATVLRPMADRRGVSMEMRVDPSVSRVRIDPFHVEQALVALLTNAVQASEPGQAVRVTVDPAPHAPRSWRLVVDDEGAGIRPEIREAIFLPYFTTKPDGNGVGLAIANKVIRAHGGQLTVESEPGCGSRFVAMLPGLVRELD